MAATKEVKLTEGRPAKLIFTFAIPLMLGNMFQQVYTIVDTMIVGRALGVTALAALGTADWYMFMIASIVTAFAQGCAILMAQDYGADDLAHLNITLAHTIMLSVIGTLLLTIFAISITGPALGILRAPAEVRPMAARYLRIYFAGLPCIMLFNLNASTLRALGNSKVPLQAMVVASLINIVLDYLFVVVFHFGVGGAAFATVLSELVSGLYCLYAVRRLSAIQVKKSDFAPEPGLNKKLISLSFPMMAQNLIIGVGGIIVVYIVNGLGVTFLAGYTATNKLYGALEAAGIAYGYAVLTYMGQNYGAGAYDRLKTGLRDALIIGVITSACIGALMVIFGHEIVALFLSGEADMVEKASAIAYEYLFVMSISLPILYILHITRSALQGLGDTVMPMLSGLAEFIMRTIMALFLSRVLGGRAIMLGEVAAWTGADLVLIPSIIRAIKTAGQSSKKISTESNHS